MLPVTPPPSGGGRHRSFLLLISAALLGAGAAWATAPPVGALPHGPTVSVTTAPGSTLAVALPRQASSTGLVWRIARPYDATIVTELSEGDFGRSVVLLFRARKPGKTSIVFALTRGETARAYRAYVYRVTVRRER